jgi:hypothetical protein
MKGLVTVAVPLEPGRKRLCLAPGERADAGAKGRQSLPGATFAERF